MTKSLNVEPGIFQYNNPYPPGYDWVLSVLHQTSGSLYWTLKFFNGLIVALGFIFFYYFVKEFSGSQTKSRFAIFILACIPCYLTHFIWAHALVVTLFFPAFYFILKSRERSDFIIPSCMLVTAIFLTQPTQSIKFVCLALILYCSMLIWESKSKHNILKILCLSAGISLVLWWGPVINDAIKGRTALVSASESSETGTQVRTFKNTSDLKNLGLNIFNSTGGSATKKYNWSHFLLPKSETLINSPVGIGLILIALSALGMIIIVLNWKKEIDHRKKIYYTTLTGWLVFTFLGLNSDTFNLPIGLFAFRFWMLFAIPVTLLAAEGMFFIMSGKYARWKIIVVACATLFIFNTCAKEKMHLLTKVWSAGQFWGSKYEPNGYVWLRKNLPPNTKVFSFVNNFVVIGYDMHNDFWDEGQKRDFQDLFERDVTHLYKALKKHGYQYLVMGSKEELYYGPKETDQKLSDLLKSELFEKQFEYKKCVWVFKVI